jgi:ABC-type multidrug transport system fused ATPase/permease subunit
MASSSTPADSLELQGLRRLGDGGPDDRLRLRLVLSILVRCLRLLRPVRWHIAALFAGFSAISIALLPVVLLFVDTLWTRVLQGQPLLEVEAQLFGFSDLSQQQVGSAAASLTQEVRRQLAWRLIWGASGIAVVLIPIGVALYYYQIWILQRVNQTLRVELMGHLQSLSLRFHSDNRVGDAIYRLTQDSSMVTQLIQVLILTPIAAGSQFLLGLGIVALFAPRLAGILALVWIPSLLAGAWFSRRLRIRFRRARESNSALTSRIQETLAGIKVIKAYQAEALERARFDEGSRDAFRAAFSSRNLYAIYHVVCFWIFGSFALFVTALGTIEAARGTALAAGVLGFSAWNLGLYNFFKGRLGTSTEALKEIFRTWGRAQDIAIGLDRVFEVIDRRPEVEDEPDAVPLDGIRDGIRFRNVAFHYQADRPVLHDVDLDVDVGTITALVGPTGSGKSTLMALLLRLFDPTSGRIEIDGLDLRQLRTASLRDNVSIALQEHVLFGTSVRENIRFAVPGATDSQVRAAAEIAAADGFIRELPKAYDTPLGERGSKLSTGQRQRLSIARAVLKDTPILILDEPTAALDAATELAVLHNLVEWGRGRVIFLITHRLSTIRRAHQIAYLHDGSIVECDSHEALMSTPNSRYRALVEAERLARAGVAK